MTRKSRTLIVQALDYGRIAAAIAWLRATRDIRMESDPTYRPSYRLLNASPGLRNRRVEELK